jgi:hypothetical protein
MKVACIADGMSTNARLKLFYCSGFARLFPFGVKVNRWPLLAMLEIGDVPYWPLLARPTSPSGPCTVIVSLAFSFAPAANHRRIVTCLIAFFCCR